MDIGSEHVNAQLVIDADAIIDTVINTSVRVVEGLDPPTVVDVLEGANIVYALDVYGANIANIRGGMLGHDDDEYGATVVAHDQSTVNIYDGYIEADCTPVAATDTSAVTSSEDAFIPMTVTECFLRQRILPSLSMTLTVKVFWHRDSPL